MAGRIAAGRGLAITYKMQVQQPTKTFCNFMQKRLAKNNKERAEVFKSVGVIGNINQIQSNAFDNVSEFEWFKANKDKCVAGLCDGYCTKPVTDGNICPRLLKRQKCYTCSRYITTPEYLDAHKQHLANLERQLEEGVIYGEHYAEHFIPTIEVLKVIIERLEGLQNGN